MKTKTEALNEIIDTLYEPTEIAGMHLSASEILQVMRPHFYHHLLSLIQSVQKQETKPKAKTRRRAK